MNSIVACCRSAKLCAHAAWAFPIATKWCCDQDVEGRARCSLHKKNVRSVRFVVKRKGCCCNLSGCIVLNVWSTTNGMCVKNNNMYTWREQAILEWLQCMNSIVACCHSAKLCTHAAWAFPIATILNEHTPWPDLWWSYLHWDFFNLYSSEVGATHYGSLQVNLYMNLQLCCLDKNVI